MTLNSWLREAEVSFSTFGIKWQSVVSVASWAGWFTGDGRALDALCIRVGPWTRLDAHTDNRIPIPQPSKPQPRHDTDLRYKIIKGSVVIQGARLVNGTYIKDPIF